MAKKVKKKVEAETASEESQGPAPKKDERAEARGKEAGRQADKAQMEKALAIVTALPYTAGVGPYREAVLSALRSAK